MKLSSLLIILNDLAPLDGAEAWDNVGLLVGDPDADVTRALACVDYTPEVALEARETGASLVLAYHPPIFSGQKRVPHDALWADAVRRGIALYSMHTALDVVRHGTNDVLADACGMASSDRVALRPRGGRGADDPAVGLGRIGDVQPTTRSSLAAAVKSALGLPAVLVSGPLDSKARRVAVAAGSGGELLEPAILAGADVFVTGEIRHHDALAAARRGVSVIMTLHSNSEREGVRAFARRVDERATDVVVTYSAACADPLRLV